MRVNRLTGENKANSSFFLDDIKKNTKDFINVKLAKKKFSPTYSVEELATVGNRRITRVKNIFGKTYVVTDDGNVYEYFDGQLYSKIKSSDGEVELVGVYFQGVESLLVLNETDGATIVSVGEKYPVDIQYSKVHLSLGNTLFIGLENRIHFTSFSFLDYIPGENFIRFPPELGEVIALVADGKTLLVFCEYAIFRMTFFGEVLDYKVEKLFDVSEGVDGQSVCAVDGKVYFIAGKELCAMTSGTIERIDTTISFKDFEVSEKAACYDGKYLLPLKRKKDEKRVLFIYGVHTGEEEIKEGCCLVEEYGLAVFEEDQSKLVRLSGEDKETDGKWTSALLDFSSMKRKVVKQIAFFSENEAKLSVRGEYGEKRFCVKKGVNVFRLNLSGRVFILELTGKGISVENLEIIYRIKGE
ncbi:MAG: hypothetical protein IJC72_00045 [Clostridia bacterium]|nr:hypothetical protein [Clostridia bacterium]